jgi:UDP-N-acetylmuramoylalanine--D-glutamate ligase
MLPPDFTGKHVVILGLARQGLALTRFFLSQGARVTVSDMATADQLSEPLRQLIGTDVRLVLGGHPLSLLDGCDLLCLSGGVPPQIPLVQAARRQGIPLSNDAQITVQRSPAPVVGITGSSGKTTTTTLVGHMLAAAGLAKGPATDNGRQRAGPGPHVWVGGNIGTPLIDRLDQIGPNDWVVLELSSFQLELFDQRSGGQSLSPHIAAILNLTPNHLDRHPSMANYAACKANVLRWQTTQDVAVLGADDALTGPWLRSDWVNIEADVGQDEVHFALSGRKLGFGLEDLGSDGCWLVQERLILRLNGHQQEVVATADIRLPGRHNVLNVMAACALAAAAGASPQPMAEVATQFSGVAHRLEIVREKNGVCWINDSIATAPERAAAALRSFERPIVLLAGGRDKNLPWQEFAALVHQRVKCLILFGEAAQLIAHAVTTFPGGGPLPLIHCSDLPEAVDRAVQVADPGDIVLLAPGGTSFDAYKDFEARGRHFRDLVNAL